MFYFSGQTVPICAKAIAILSLCSVLGTALFGRPAASNDKQGALVRVAVPAGVPNFAQPFTRSGNAAIRFAVFDTLTREDSQGRLGPVLARTWSMETPLTWIFSLRSGVQFHNGAPFNSAAVVETIKILQRTSGVGYDLNSEVGNIAGVEAIDDLTVRFRTTEPDPILPRRLGLIRMIEPDAWKKMGPEQYAREPVGTGPYRISSWGSGGAITSLKAASNSWRAPKTVERIEVTNVPDGTARVQALLSGQADIVFALSPEDIAPIEAAGAIARVFPAPMVMGLTLRNVGVLIRH